MDENPCKMKTKKKTLKLRSLKLLLVLLLLIMMLLAFSDPKNIFPEHSTNSKSPKTYRPILDSTIVCSRYETWWGEEKLEFFYIVEHMPDPDIPISELENILEREIRFNLQELSCNDFIYFQCVVNCMGKAGDFQILKCPEALINIGCQVLNVLSIQLSDWEPPVQRDKNVDLLVRIGVAVENGNFKVVAPLY